MEYLRSTYGDRRELLGAFAEACRADQELSVLNTNLLAAGSNLAAIEMDDRDPKWKAAYEAMQQSWQQRNDRAQALDVEVQDRALDSAAPGRRTLYIPTSEDAQRCFQEYVEDARTRSRNHQLKPTEYFQEDGSGRVQVSGQGAVMEINGRLAKIIFDRNPGHQFYVEESFPLDWMYPHLEPHGLIMKINRESLAALSDATVRRDREFWESRATQMIGDWLNDRTPVSAVVAFGERTFLRHDLRGFSGDPRYVQNDYACRMFSKFRAAIAGVYAWRAEHDPAAGDQARMAAAADFAFRQALALCAYSPEAASRYASFLTQQQRGEDAKRVLAMSELFKPESSAKAATAKAPVLQIRLATESPTDNAEPMRLESGTGSPERTESLYVAKEVLLDQSSIQSARLGGEGSEFPTIAVSLTDAGRDQFAKITREHVHQRLTIVMAGKLWMAPVIQTEIPGGQIQITGAFSRAEAGALVAEINEAAGKRP